MPLLPRENIIGAKIVQIAHSRYSEPTWILDGIGPASFRCHYIALDSGLILDLFTAEITLATPSDLEMPGETNGIPVDDLIGRAISALARDDMSSSLIILDNSIVLRDANDGATGNPLVATYVSQYTDEELSGLVDYWSELPISIRRLSS